MSVIVYMVIGCVVVYMVIGCVVVYMMIGCVVVYMVIGCVVVYMMIGCVVAYVTTCLSLTFDPMMTRVFFSLDNTTPVFHRVMTQGV